MMNPKKLHDLFGLKCNPFSRELPIEGLYDPAADLLDTRSGKFFCCLYPLDKQANADGVRRGREPLDLPAEAEAAPTGPATCGLAPLLADLMAEHQPSGLPPAYQPKYPAAQKPSGQPEVSAEADQGKEKGEES